MRPDLIVLKGQPDDAELAALVAVLTALSARAAAPAQDAGRESLWTSGPAKPAYRPPGAWTWLRGQRSA